MQGWAKITCAVGSWADIMLLPNRTKKITCPAKGTGRKFKHLWIEEVTVNSVNDYVQPDPLISYDDAEVGNDMTDRYPKWTSKYGEWRELVIGWLRLKDATKDAKDASELLKLSLSKY